MVTITKVEEKLKQNGKKSWKFSLSDGVQGYITNDKPWDYKEGESVTYTKEEKKTPNGAYNLLTLTRATSAPAPVQTPAPSAPQEQTSTPTREYFRSGLYQKDMRAEVPFHSSRLVMDAFIEGRLTWEQIPKCFTEMNEMLLRAIDECGKEDTGSTTGESK